MMDKTQFRTLMLHGKQVWIHPVLPEDYYWLYADGSKIKEFGYIWSACNEHEDSVWVGKSFGDKEPEQARFHMSRVHVHMDSYTLPLEEVFEFIDKLGGFEDD